VRFCYSANRRAAFPQGIDCFFPNEHVYAYSAVRLTYRSPIRGKTPKGKACLSKDGGGGDEKFEMLDDFPTQIHLTGRSPRENKEEEEEEEEEEEKKQALNFVMDTFVISLEYV